MPTLTEPPDGWGYPEPEEPAKPKDRGFTKDDFDYELLVDDQFDRWREAMLEEEWEED